MKFTSPLFPFEHPKVLQTAMPMGGIGAGSICFNGYGGLQDFSIRNRADLTGQPEHTDSADAAFALIHLKGTKPLTRLVEGPIPPEKIYNLGTQTEGYRKAGFEGLPRFRKSRFRSGYPFGQVDLSDPQLPLQIRLMAWSPFIPLDDVASGIPCTILEYTVKNTSKKKVEAEFSYHLSHLAGGPDARSATGHNEVIPRQGVYFFNTEPPHAETHGSAALTVIGHKPKIKAMWLRGAWFDSVSSLWREIEAEKFTPNDGKADDGKEGRNGGSLAIKLALAPGEEITIPVVIAWHFPNCSLVCGRNTPKGDPLETASPKWQPFYTTQWKNAREVTAYVHKNYASLRERTVAFQKALLSTTAPAAILDAVSANLAIMKSPTVLRQANGNMWGWEGSFSHVGCCHGSCTHVWNYTQGFPHLFPQLERTLREQELERSMDSRGHVNFRSALPDGPPEHHEGPAASDGQLGGIMKLYRDWQISGDDAWLKKMYPLARKSLEYCIRTWDPDHKGVLIEPHHNTYDIEFWGPDGMCTSVYIGALSAMSIMAEGLGKAKDHSHYHTLAVAGSRWIEQELFNGEYFEQKVQYRNLRDKSFLKLIGGKTKTSLSEELIRLMKKEGPRYQYGTGCLSDGVIGAWMANIYGIKTPLSRAKVRKHLQSIFRYNYRATLKDHSNCQRPGYAIGDEPGLLLCSWPRGGKPTLPFVYSDEVWTGIEYQVASHLISEGLTAEGVQIVKSVRSRYTGEVRNPWNEYECGGYYARAMASYALLGSLSGFRYSAVEQILWFGPQVGKRPFTTFFSTASGYGTISLDKNSLIVSVLEGSLAIESVMLTLNGKTLNLLRAAVAKPGKPAKFSLKAVRR